MPVTVYEAGTYPRHRVCGEFITGLADSTIARLRLAPALAGALRHEEVAWSIHGAAPHIQRLPSPALGLSRHLLDARLAQAFTTAGGELHTQSRMAENGKRSGRVQATGRRRATEPQWIGLKIHVRALPLIRDLEMHLGDECYVGLARIEDGAVNLCGLFRRRPLSGRGLALLLAYLRAAGLAALAARIDSAAPDAGSFCAVAALGFDPRVPAAQERILLGDASAMIPPFTGNGMAMAFQSAEAALSPLLGYSRGETDWRTACHGTAAALRGRFRMRLAAAAALHPFLLRPHRQRWFAALGRARLLPFGSLYATLH